MAAIQTIAKKTMKMKVQDAKMSLNSTLGRTRVTGVEDQMFIFKGMW